MSGLCGGASHLPGWQGHFTKRVPLYASPPRANCSLVTMATGVPTRRTGGTKCCRNPLGPAEMTVPTHQGALPNPKHPMHFAQFT